MKSAQRNQQDEGLEELLSLYEDGYSEIKSILVDGDLTGEEQLDSIAGVVFGDEVEEED